MSENKNLQGKLENIFNGMKMRTAYQNLREAAKAVVRGKKFTALSTALKGSKLII